MAVRRSLVALGKQHPYNAVQKVEPATEHNNENENDCFREWEFCWDILSAGFCHRTVWAENTGRFTTTKGLEFFSAKNLELHEARKNRQRMVVTVNAS